MLLQYFAQNEYINVIIEHLPASKSESNRALIIQHLGKYQQQNLIYIQNLSEANDTKVLLNLLENQENKQEFDAQDAGTVFRFMTAYLAITQKNVILTGTSRMQERPIFPLVDALKMLGFEIDYLQKKGFPPLKFIKNQTKKNNFVRIKANISSQFISALLMIAPLLADGLSIDLEGEISSKPYILMTLSQMNFFGIEHKWQENMIKIEPQTYKNNTYIVEGDWSAASYWFILVSLKKKIRLFLPNLFSNSKQGDSKIIDLMALLGVKTEFENNGIFISHQKKCIIAAHIEIDFIDFPDLAQTLAVLCVLKEIKATFIGLESLKIKETNRIEALQNELPKIGGEMIEIKEGVFEISMIENFIYQPTKINTYHDHRMCMSFAMSIFKFGKIEIENSECVNKSYPKFWKDLQIFTLA